MAPNKPRPPGSSGGFDAYSTSNPLLVGRSFHHGLLDSLFLHLWAADDAKAVFNESAIS